MKTYSRTTVVLNVELLKKLKEYSAETGKNMRQIMSEAIESKIQGELDPKHKRSSQSARFEKNVFAQKMLDELKEIVTPKTAEIIIIQKCEEHGLSVNKLSKKTATPELVKGICMSVGHVADAKTATRLEDRLQSMIKDEGES